MSILDLASMVLAPTAVKDGKVYNAIPNDQDFTFSRGTEATRVNSAGLIEKARTNFLLQSNTFNTTWSLSNGTLTGGQTGYDGSSDAWQFDASGTAQVSQSVSTSGVQTYSVYAKAGTENGLFLRANGGSNPRCFFNLDSGTIGSEAGGLIDSNIEDIGNGWYRCSIVYSDTTNEPRIYVANNSNGFPSSGNILIQSAQLEQGLVSTDVITTTTSSVTVGITDDLPRVDYSGGGCPSLLLEGSRTNLFPQSEYLKDTNHWQVQNVSFSVNQGTSPEGQNNAIKVVPNSTGAAYWFDDTTLTSGQPYVLSFYAKSDGWDYLQVTNSSGVGGSETENFDIINGTSNGDYATGDAVIEEFGNGWYKIIVKGTANASTGRMVIALSSGLTMSRLGSVTPSGSDGVLLYAFQWEQGSYVSSYLPSYGTSTSRSADSWYVDNLGQTTAYTIFIDYKFLEEADANFEDYISFQASGSNQDGLRAEGVGSDWRLYGYNISGSVSFPINGSVSAKKKAIVVSSQGIKLFEDGALADEDLSGMTVPTLGAIVSKRGTSAPYPTEIKQGYNQLVVFSSALTDDQCIALTK